MNVVCKLVMMSRSDSEAVSEATPTVATYYLHHLWVELVVQLVLSIFLNLKLQFQIFISIFLHFGRNGLFVPFVHRNVRMLTRGRHLAGDDIKAEEK